MQKVLAGKMQLPDGAQVLPTRGFEDWHIKQLNLAGWEAQPLGETTVCPKLLLTVPQTVSSVYNRYNS